MWVSCVCVQLVSLQVRVDTRWCAIRVSWGAILAWKWKCQSHFPNVWNDSRFWGLESQNHGQAVGGNEERHVEDWGVLRVSCGGVKPCDVTIPVSLSRGDMEPLRHEGSSRGWGGGAMYLSAMAQAVYFHLTMLLVIKQARMETSVGREALASFGNVKMAHVWELLSNTHGGVMMRLWQFQIRNETFRCDSMWFI